MKKLFILTAISWCGLAHGWSADLAAAEKLRASGKFDHAETEYRAVLTSKLQTLEWPEAKFGLALCHEERKRFRDAEKLFSEILREFPSSKFAPEAAWNIIRLRCGSLHDRRGALEMAEKLADWKPGSSFNERGLYAVAVINYWDKRKKKSKAACLDYLKVYSDGIYGEAVKELLSKVGG